jgi:predicted aminopeptidase
MRPTHADLPLPGASMRRPSGTRPNTKYSTHRSRAEDFEGCLLRSSYRKRKRQRFSSPVGPRAGSANQSLGRLTRYSDKWNRSKKDLSGNATNRDLAAIVRSVSETFVKSYLWVTSFSIITTVSLRPRQRIIG